MKLKKLLSVLLIACCLFSLNTSIVYADEVTEEVEGTDSVDYYSPCAGYIAEEQEQCIADMESNISTPKFYSYAIMSLDSSVRAVEIGMDYVKNFVNSSVTAICYDLSLFNPDTIIMAIGKVLIDFVELLGLGFTLVTMLLYNIGSSSFWSSIITNIFASFDEVLFDFSNPNSWFIKILILFTFIAIIKRLAEAKKATLNYKTSINIIAQVILSASMILGVTMYGKPVISYVENLAAESLTISFGFDDSYNTNLPLEVNVKAQLFEVLQVQGFTLRHFGVTDISQFDQASSTAEQNMRLEILLNEPTTTNAKSDRNKGNDYIGYNSTQVFSIFGLSLVFFVHRIFMCILFSIASLFLIGVAFFKEVTLATSLYALSFKLLKRDSKIATNWFLSRIKWFLIFAFSNIVFNMLVTFMLSLINGISSIDNGASLLLLLPFDLLLFFSAKFLVKNGPALASEFMEGLNLESGTGAFNIAKGVITGELQPEQLSNVAKEMYDDRFGKTDDKSESTNSKKNTSSLSDVTDNEALSDKEVVDTDSNVNDQELNSLQTNKDITEQEPNVIIEDLIENKESIEQEVNDINNLETEVDILDSVNNESSIKLESNEIDSEIKTQNNIAVHQEIENKEVEENKANININNEPLVPMDDVVEINDATDIDVDDLLSDILDEEINEDI